MSHYLGLNSIYLNYNQSKERIFKNACIRKHLASLQYKFSIFKFFHETFFLMENWNIYFLIFHTVKKYVTQLQSMHLSCIYDKHYKSSWIFQMFSNRGKTPLLKINLILHIKWIKAALSIISSILFRIARLNSLIFHYL